MNAYEIILKKRNGGSLTEEEIRYMVEGFTEGKVPDYQMSAFLMAIWFKHLGAEERACLTREMIETGQTFSYPGIDGPLVDKHSTGGVGDGVSLSLLPLVASFGIPVPMMSGRGLGHTGGTLDKLESIPGFRVGLDHGEVKRLLGEVGGVFMGQTDEIAPADREMYALRDVTGTVDSVDLIASSIMSKKIAEGMDALILDVKTGSGAFMTEYGGALELARAMVEIGTQLDRNVRALITDMDQPLGRTVGNALEMKQAIRVLREGEPDDLTEVVCQLAGEMLVMGGEASDRESGREMAHRQIQTGAPVEKLRQIIEAQEGDPRVIEDPSLFPGAEREQTVVSPDSGHVQTIDAFKVGMAAKVLGAGRESMEAEIDLGAGLVLKKKVGDKVKQGEPLVRMLYNSNAKPKQAREKLLAAYEIGDGAASSRPLVFSAVDGDGHEHRLDVPRPAEDEPRSKI